MKSKPALTGRLSFDGKAVGSIAMALQTDVERINAVIGYRLGEK
jgi:hypothetical protein